ncbi:M50 family peptidase [Thalassotalea sp. HSM 43]|uniref:M50 family metallopeptidase n=1 Tax=Thalassotalea sp. HSM 43 TaxID=2552945 RepID=UPI0010818915|nr:M50 family metallopeptidase [Thalassotalea sp. HSM 43]QBY03065.1 M50 family peptidase [Thalassotalea sp. HSM 43]
MSQSSNNTSSTSVRLFTNVYLLLLLAIVIKYLPIVSIPFEWLESYFHEISHGIAALLSGGHIVQIQLFANGAGLCTTRGGSPMFIAFAGYFGAAIWAMVIFSLANVHDKISRVLSYLLVALLVASMIFWVRDFLTLFICLILVGVFALSIKIQHLGILKGVLQLIALSVVLSAIKSPLYLMDNRAIGDASALQQMTMLPEVVWILFWCGFGLFALYRMLRSAHTSKLKTKAKEAKGAVS